MIYYLTIIICSVAMALSFVTGMVWFEYVASESYAGKGDVDSGSFSSFTEDLQT